MNWFSSKLTVYIIGGIIAVGVVIAAVTFIDRSFDNTETVGELRAENESYKVTLDQAKAARDAEIKFNVGGDPARYDMCMRNIAPGYESGCNRYKPHQSVPDRSPDADTASPGT